MTSALSGAQVWRLQAPLQAEVDKNVRHLNDLDSPTTGFHVRGGDKLQEDLNGVRSAPPLRPLRLRKGLIRHDVLSGGCLHDTPAQSAGTLLQQESLSGIMMMMILTAVTDSRFHLK